MIKKWLLSPLLLITFLLRPAFADELSLIVGGHYFTGDYGQKIDTDIYYAPITVQYDYQSWSAKLTIPYLSVEGPGTFIGGELVVIEGSTDRNKEEGLGDVITSLTYKIDTFEDEAIWLDITANLKWPTADKKRGLGVGTHDLGIEVSIAKALLRKGWEKYALFSSVGYKFRGRSDEYDFINSANFSVGAQRSIGSEVGVGLMYNFYEASTKTGKHSEDVLSYVSWQVSPQWSVMGYGSVGLTQSASDFGTGFSLTYKFK